MFPQFAAVMLLLLHYSLFAANGYGLNAAVFYMSDFGSILEIISQSLFMLLLLLLAMGWAVTRQKLSCKITLVSLWVTYVMLHLILYLWMKVLWRRWKI